MDKVRIAALTFTGFMNFWISTFLVKLLTLCDA